MVASGDGAYSLERGDTRVVFSTQPCTSTVCVDVRCAGRVELATVCVGVVWRYCLIVSQPCMRAALRVRES